jgi:cytochrome c biogenesis protein ResB
MGLLLVLDRDQSGAPVLALIGLDPNASQGSSAIAFLNGVSVGQTSEPAQTGGYTIRWSEASAYTGMVIKRDPGQGLVWLAYLSLIVGLTLTFYFPRRRFWARFENGRLQMAMLADRYVDTEREFETIVDRLGARLGRPGM